MNIGEKIRAARVAKGMTQEELGDLVGVQKSAIAKYESGRVVNIKRSTLKKLSDILEIPPFELIYEGTTNDNYAAPDNIFPISVKRFPVLGKIACGEPIYADEDHESYIMASANIKADFCLVAKGDSMINARINDGDVVFIHSQPTVENGEIAAVIIGDEATLKRVYIKANVVTLVAENPKYEPMVYAGDELESIRILGKAVCFMSNL